MENPFAGALDAIKGLLSRESDQPKPIGPGDVGPSIETRKTGGVQLVSLSMTEAECQEWWGRIKRARDRVKNRESQWDTLLKEYLPIVSQSGSAETVKVMQHFRNVHSKIGQMFYRTPDLVLTGKDPSMLNTQLPNPMPGPEGQMLPPLTMDDIVAVKQQVLNDKLGRDGIKANRLIDELLFDVLAWAGFGACKVGYRCVYRPVAEPAPMDPGINPLGAMGAPMESVPVPVFEEWYARRFSPKKALWNDDLRSTRFDEDATWMGMEFFMSAKQAKAFGLSDEEVAKATSDDRVHKYEEDGATGGGLIHGVEIWCKANYFTDEVHPQAINQLVLIEGMDKPVVWRKSPDQDFDERGRLTKDSMVGFPIRILTIRDLADSAFPPADSAFTNSEIKQKTTLRRQAIKRRDKAIGKYLFETGAFSDDEVKRLKDADTDWIGVEDGRLGQGGDKIVSTTPQVTGTQDDYRLEQVLDSDITETLGISANAAGSYATTVRTATEAANVQTNMQGRNGKEMGRVVDFYLDLARMVDQLLMRYADEEDYVEITGPEGSKRMQIWNRMMIQGRCLYNIAPDSSLMVDTTQDFNLTAQYWNLSAKSPLTNQAYILKKLAQMRRLDPSKAVLPPQALQKPEPEKGKFTMSLKGEDLANPLVVKLLIDNGIIKAEDAALNQPVIPAPPEGPADKADVVSRHLATNSGGRQNAPGAGNFREQQAGD